MDWPHTLSVVGGSTGLLTALGAVVQLARTQLRNRAQRKLKELEAQTAVEVASLEHDAKIGPILTELLRQRDQRIAHVEQKMDAQSSKLEEQDKALLECKESHAKVSQKADECTQGREKDAYERQLLHDSIAKIEDANNGLRAQLLDTKATLQVMERRQQRLKARVSEAGIDVDDTGQIHLDELTRDAEIVRAFDKKR